MKRKTTRRTITLAAAALLFSACASTDEPSKPTKTAAPEPVGLTASQDGYTLRLSSQKTTAGETRPIEFTIVGPGDKAVTKFDVAHEKKLHFIVVRRDFTGFQHVHPEMDSAGRWTTSVDLEPGPWRVFADFVPSGGDPLTLGADLAVDGDYQAEQAMPEKRTSDVDDYQVTLDGDLASGMSSEVTLTVTKSGKPVTDLQPYLGAYGHLVALREKDLAYLHVHPGGKPKAGPNVVFYAEVPSGGRYHLFFDFRHEDVVRTADFVVKTGPGEVPSLGGDHSGH